MKKLLTISLVFSLFLSSCGGGNNGELVGVLDRVEWFEPDPYGMQFIPMGSFNMGPSGQDVPFALTGQTKTVSIDPFWMDETEITNNEYRQFVFWVRDSIARRILGEINEEFFISEDKKGNPIDPPFLNWEEEIDWKDEEYVEPLDELYLPEHERFFRRKEIDTRKLLYEYFWIDLKQAAKTANRYNFDEQKYGQFDKNGSFYTGEIIDSKGNKVPIKDRSSFIMSGKTNVYPDTLVWMSDFSYAYNDPMTISYFWHAAYDDYPVVGVNWVQANAFAIWRTQLKNDWLQKEGEYFVQEYRLPTEAEWEYAARGGLALGTYPWGGPYTRNHTGCFIANFKPLRGNYQDDGGIRTLATGSFAPNDYGLFDMAGNVAEWTSNAFDESAYSFTHDLNPDYRYNALKDDPPVLKRKVVRGGSWKDIAYYLQVGVRTYEYQDTSKSYIGFRCVRSYMGRATDQWSQ